MTGRFQLPEIEFIGGTTKELQFRTLFSENRRPFDLSQCQVQLTLVDSMDVYGEQPLVDKAAAVTDSRTADGQRVSNVIRAELTPGETVELNGSYIYQLTIRERGSGRMEQYQGKMYIHSNVNRDYVSGT